MMVMRRRVHALLALFLACLVAIATGWAWAQQGQGGQGQGRPRPAPAQPAPATRPAPIAVPANPLQPETSARQAVILDLSTNTVLFEKNADERMTPSSLSKLMTAYVVFDALKRGDVRLEDTLLVSERAARMGGSRMFVSLGERVKVEDLLRGMIVQSGNDACVVLAEGLSGSEDAFAERMNRMAQALGLAGSRFRNASGWPHPEHYMTARDLLTLSQRLIRDFPEYYRYYSERDFTYGRDPRGTPIVQQNRNPLLYRASGADGLKTGHTESGGFGLSASAQREGRRIIMIANGWQSIRARAEEGERLMEWAFREYGTYTLFKAGQAVETAPVWLGRSGEIRLVPAQDVLMTLPRRYRDQIVIKAIFDSPLRAPIAAGQKLGQLQIAIPERPPVDFPLVAATDVEKLGFSGRVIATLGQLATMAFGGK
jgi:D-alanyl-D-alanine carboxypeptidase (penicillin-binding protein 5/6)